MEKIKQSKKLNMVVGCGNLGANIALTLSAQGEDVVVIDKNKQAFVKLGSDFGGMTLEGDATDIAFIGASGAETACAFITVTNNDNTNIMIAQIAKEMFGIKKVIARLYDSERSSVYEELGIETVCPELLSAIEIKKLLNREA